MESPRHPHPYPDRDLDCQTALKPAFARVISDLSQQPCGMSRQETASARICRVLAEPDDEPIIAEQVAHIVARARVAGWHDREIDAGLAALAKTYVVPAGASGD